MFRAMSRVFQCNKSTVGVGGWPPGESIVGLGTEQKARKRLAGAAKRAYLCRERSAGYGRGES